VPPVRYGRGERSKTSDITFEIVVRVGPPMFQPYGLSGQASPSATTNLRQKMRARELGSVLGRLGASSRRTNGAQLRCVDAEGPWT